MTTPLRAALSVVLLAGFYVLALGMIGVLGGLTFLAVTEGRVWPTVQLGVLTLVSVAGVVLALVRVARAARAAGRGEAGVLLTRQDAPELWRHLHELARIVRTRMPDEVRLVPEVNAAVSEDTRFLGLVGGRRRLYLGVPLLQGLTVGQVRSVLAHELGHYSSAHTRLAPVAYRGREAVLATVAELHGNVVGKVLERYAYLYLLVSAAVSRSQELEADRLSVAAAGREVAQGALRELPVLDAAWDTYLGQYVTIGLRHGYAPTSEGFFAGFGAMLAARTEELGRRRTQAPPARQSRWDSHPPVAARVEAMETMPDAGFAVHDTRPATRLVPGFDRVAATVVDAAFEFRGDPQRLEWAPLVALSVGKDTEEVAAGFLETVARLAQRPSADVPLLLDLLTAGWFAELARAVAPGEPAEDAADHARYLIRTAFQVEAVRSGAGTWLGSWAGPAMVVAPNGAVLDIAQVADLASTTQGAPAARKWLEAAGVLAPTIAG